MDKKINVGILYGGRSVEHDISVISAKNIVKYLDKTIYTPILIGIDKNGDWFINQDIEDNISKGDALALMLNASQPALINKKNGQQISLDIVFPVLHGTDGEDGSIQGALKAVSIPFVGSGVLGSAVSMNKLSTKKLLNAADIPTSAFISFYQTDKDKIEYETLVAQLGSPFMAKPANLGSSVGVSKIKDAEGLASAIKEVFEFDNIIIFETFISGRELECAVMGNQSPVASVPGEITISEGYDFYTFEAKYVDKDAAKITIPAHVGEEAVEKIKSLCIKAYQALFCEDFARVDLFLTEDGEVYINEINTIPGFTDVSMFPKLWEQAGIMYSELLTKLITMAIERSDRNKNTTTFASGLH